MDEICSLFQFSVVIQHNCQVHRDTDKKQQQSELAGCLVWSTLQTNLTNTQDITRTEGGNPPQCAVSGVTQDKPR